jgi:hypothetical protein
LPFYPPLQGCNLGIRINDRKFQQFFPLSSQDYSHLMTKSICIQLWQELEPSGLILRPNSSLHWTPLPLCTSDRLQNEIAIKCYNTKGSAMINGCRMFMQVTLILDLQLLLSIHPSIHPSIHHTSKVTFHYRVILQYYGPLFPRPPKTYWALWNHFLRHHIMPLVISISFPWDSISTSRFLPNFFKHRSSHFLYYKTDDQLTLYKLCPGARSRFRAVYDNVPYQCNIEYSSDQVFPVDIGVHISGISIVGDWPIHLPTLTSAATPN